MKKITTIIIVLLSFIFVYIFWNGNMQSQSNAPKFSLSESFVLKSAQEYNGDIYFIGSSEMLYRIDKNMEQELFFDQSIKSFALTNEYLVCIDTNDVLHVMMLYRQVDKALKLDISNTNEYIVTDNGLVYKNSQGQLLYLNYLNWNSSLVIEGKVHDFMTHNGSLFYLADSQSAEKSKEIVNYNPNTGESRTLAVGDIDGFSVVDSGLYYMQGGSIFRMNETVNIREKLMSNAYSADFMISNGRMLARADELYFDLYDLQRGKMRQIGAKDFSIVDSYNGNFLLTNNTARNIMIITESSDVTIGYKKTTELVGTGFVGEYIYASLYDTLADEMSFNLYDLDGGEVYKH